LENLDDNVDSNKPWQSITENIKTLAREKETA